LPGDLLEESLFPLYNLKTRLKLHRTFVFI
jgi:hypothetical protein